MNFEVLTAVAAFAFVASVTPGPNNLMLMASGANFGFARTVPHMLGVCIGFMLMLFLVGIGLMGVFDAVPASYLILKVLGVAYLLYLAWRIATAAPPGEGVEERGKPFTFIQAALFQWVNPKAWTMGLTAITIYTPTRSLGAILTIVLIFGVVNIPSISIWTLLGQQLRQLLNNRIKLRLFNGLMGLLLVASLYPVLAPA